jgi:DNA transformation protein
MPLSPGFIEFAEELIAGFGPVEVKKMFGGASLSRGGVGFAILDDDTIFIRADAVFGAELKKQGSKAWSYSIGKDGKPREIAYWSLPDTALDDPDEASALAKRSHAISKQVVAAKDKVAKAKASKKAAKPAAKTKPKAVAKPKGKK